MKRQALSPQDSFILDLFIRDTIDRSADVVRLCNIINSTEGCYTIAINGAWGSGKTFYIKQAKILLDYLNGTLSSDSSLSEQIDFFLGVNPHFDKLLQRKNNAKTIYYDAWENDNDIDPVLSILYSIIKSGQFKVAEKSSHDFGRILSSVAEVVSGRNVTALFDAAKGEDFLSVIKEQKSISTLTDDFFRDMCKSNDDKIVLFIDELDRCKPSYTIAMLERIKHYFNNDKLVFVFALNLDQLQHTVKSYYGVEFDASRYLDKFFDLIIPMPPYNQDKFLSNIDFNKTEYFPRRVSRAVIKSLNLQMREQEKFVELVKFSGLERLTQGRSTSFADDRAYFFTMAYILPLILGLQIVDLKSYYEFTQGSTSIPLFNLLSTLDTRTLDNSGLLGKNETFLPVDQNTTGLRQASLEQLASEVCKILFKNSYAHSNNYEIGGLLFDKEIHDDLLRNACLMSKNAEFK